MRIMKNLKGEPYGGAWPIEDSNVLDCINNFLYGKKYIELNTINTQTYLERFFEFICGSNNDLHGIGDYTSKAFSLGTTNAFDSFFIKHSKKRLVSFSGEYVYHGIVQRTIDGSTNTLTDSDQLKKGDALVISVPFADTGDEHEQLEDVLIACFSKNFFVFLITNSENLLFRTLNSSEFCIFLASNLLNFHMRLFIFFLNLILNLKYSLNSSCIFEIPSVFINEKSNPSNDVPLIIPREQYSFFFMIIIITFIIKQ